MAEQIYNVKCGFFDAVNNDRVYTAEDMNRLYKRVIHDGVFPDENNNPSDDLLVEADSGMTITVGTGEGVFASHWFKNSVDIPIEVPTNSANDRIDSVVIQVDTRKSGRAGNIVYRTGEPSINPAPPQINEVLGVVEYRLANITVASGATAITSADITDLRGTSECPWVTGIVSANDIPPNSVTGAKIATDAVTTPKIKDKAVTGAKIATGTIGTTNIGIGQIKTANIDGGAVTSDKIGDGEVKTINIENDSVTYNKLASDVLSVLAGKLDTARLVTGSGVVSPVDIQALNGMVLDRRTFYYIYLASDVLYSGSPRENCVILELESDHQLIIRPNGEIYSREYTTQWSDFERTTAGIEANINTRLPYERLTGANNSPINLSTLNELTVSPFTFYYLYKGTDIIPDVNTNEYALFFPLTALSQVIILANGDIYSRQRESTSAAWGAFTKNTAEIESDISTLKYNSAQAQAAIIRLNDEVADIKATITQVNTQLENAINGVSE